MVTPDFSKINSTNRDSSVPTNDEKTRRKSPIGDFNKVVEEVDERNQTSDNSSELLTKPKKKSTGKIPGQKGEETAYLSPFELARGYRDNADEQQKEPDQPLAPLTAFASSNSVTSTKADIQLKSEKEISNEVLKPIEKHATPHHPLLKAYTEKSDEQNFRFGTVEQPDLASVTPYPQASHPLVNPTTAATASIKAEPTPISPKLQEVIDQIVSKVLILKESGQTETVVELEGSFKGSRLIVTQIDSAKGQINITIDNLSTENQRILETNRLSLVNDLLEKNGIQVNIFTASAIRENTSVDVAINDQEQSFKDNREDNPRRDNRRQKSDDQP